MDFGIVIEGMIKTDSNAAIGIVHRSGLGGRCRHIRVQYLWIQEKVKLGELSISKVHGKGNPADLMTKGLNGEDIAKHMKCLGFDVTSGRAEKSSGLYAIDRPGLILINGCRGCLGKVGGECISSRGIRPLRR